MFDLMDVLGVDVEKDSLATVIKKINKFGLRSAKYIYKTGNDVPVGLFLFCADPVAVRWIDEAVDRIEDEVAREEEKGDAISA